MLHNRCSTQNILKKTALACAMTTLLGSAIVSPLSADVIEGEIEGVFTLLGPTGIVQKNSDNALKPWYGNRTVVTGTIHFDTEDSSENSMDIVPFSFFSAGLASATGISFARIGDGSGDPSTGTLMLSNMGFNWGGSNGIGVSLVWDAQEFLTRVSAGVNIGDTITGGVLPASDGHVFGTGMNKYTLPIHAAPLATTTFNTTTLTDASGDTPLGTNPSGSLPLIVDTSGFSGSPMPNGPFPNNNASFDFTSITVTNFTDTTPPVVDITPDSIQLDVGDTFDPLNPPGVTITITDAGDTVLGNPALTTADCTIGNPVDAGVPGTYTVTYSCTDGANNSNTMLPLPSLLVTVAGVGEPTITGPATVNHEAATPFTQANAMASCVDSDGTTAITGADFTLDIDLLDVDTVGAQSVAWNCTGSSGSATFPVAVNVQDTTPPVITLSPGCPISFEADGVTDPTPTATAEDPNYETNLTAEIVKTGVPVNPAQDFGNNLSVESNLGYEVTDSNGLKSAPLGCQITLGNPNPVATLNGEKNPGLSDGTEYEELGATCEDFADGQLSDATLVTEDTAGNSVNPIDGSTPDGAYTITYSCVDSDSNTGQVQRTVTLGAAYIATAITSGSKFIMLNSLATLTGDNPDVSMIWSGDLITNDDILNDPDASKRENATIDNEEAFFGDLWTAHDVRMFGPGTYEFEACPGPIEIKGDPLSDASAIARDGSTHCLNKGQAIPPLRIVVGPNQIGAHVLFDWSNSKNIDVGLVWDINGVFDGKGAPGESFNLAVSDSDGDGIPGQPMIDGPFKSQNANFNFNFITPFTLPDASVSARQGSNDPTSIIVSTSDTVILSANVNPATNSVPYAGPFTYDWSGTDAALLAASSNGMTSQTFEFNPLGLAEGGVTAIVKATDSPTGLTSTVEVPLQVVNTTLTDPSVVDDDQDGIPNAQDDSGLGGQRLQAISLDSTTFLLESSTGNLVLGTLARSIASGSSAYQAGVASTDLPITDMGVESSCLGGCFDYMVSGLVVGSSVDIVLPLSAAIPGNAGFRKLINNQWRDFNTTNGNAIASTIGVMGNCPAPSDSSWVAGLTEGDFCVRLSIVDGGANDSDGVANGVVVDPGGVSGPSTTVLVVPGSARDPNVGGGGCTLNSSTTQSRQFADWWILGGFIAILGWVRRKTILK